MGPGVEPRGDRRPARIDDPEKLVKCRRGRSLIILTG
jgi:hypothetical protein